VHVCIPNFTKIEQPVTELLHLLTVSNMAALKASTVLVLTDGVFWEFRDFCLSILYANGLPTSIRSSRVERQCSTAIKHNSGHICLCQAKFVYTVKFFWVRCIHWIFLQVYNRGSHPLPSESRRSHAVHCNMSGCNYCISLTMESVICCAIKLNCSDIGGMVFNAKRLIAYSFLLPVAGTKRDEGDVSRVSNH